VAKSSEASGKDPGGVRGSVGSAARSSGSRRRGASAAAKASATAEVSAASSTSARIAAAGPVGVKLAQLREVAATDPDGAQEQAWDWFLRLGAARDEDSLEDLFRLGDAKPMSGPTDGILLAIFMSPVLDRLGIALLGPGRPTMPWNGKTFDPVTETGANRFKPWFPALSRLAWPFYRGRRMDGDEHLMFDMRNGDIEDPLDPGHTIWKIDYRDKDLRSPWFIRHCLDTLVEVVPGAHLGRLYYDRGGRYSTLLYFALKPSA
jgi:hypothetical protein